MAMDFAGASSKSKIISRSRPAAATMFRPCSSKRSKKRSSRGISWNTGYRDPAAASPRRVRARHHSTPIGIIESTMTTPITMWM